MYKTIASLALIKVNWDAQRKDYIQIFVPFISALLRKKHYSVVEINKVSKDFQDEFGLVIPYHPMITILERARKQGLIQKNKYGKYIPVAEKFINDDFSEVAHEQEQKYSNVLKKFIGFSGEKGETINEEQAEAIIVSFFKAHDLDILFASVSDVQTLLPTMPREHENNEIVKTYLINSFFIYAYESDPETFGFIVDLSIGHLMANTLLYNRDYQKFQGRFSGEYYLDTGLLFYIVGINGEERREAYCDFIKLLQESGARILIFRHTYEEFIGILENCLNWVESQSIDPAKASRALIYFVDNGFSCSDVERFILNIDKILDSLNISVVPVPDPNVDIAYQIDEQNLEKMIVDSYKENIPNFDKEEKDYTIQQDIKSFAAIYKLRKGCKPLKISDVKHLFITTNSTLALISRKFEVSPLGADKFFFIPTCLTDVFIGTLVWLNSPVKVLEISQKRLIANSYAALRPSRTLLRKYASEIDKLKEQGEIADNEATILKVSRVARNLLIDETRGDPDRFTDKTAIEILAEMRESIRNEELEKLKPEKQKIQEEQARLKEREEILELEKIQIEKQYSTQLKEKDGEISNVKQDRDSIVKNVGCLVNTIAYVLAGGFYLVTVGMIVLATIVQLSPQTIQLPSPIHITVVVIAAILGIVSIITGFNIKGTGNYLRHWLKAVLMKLFKK